MLVVRGVRLALVVCLGSLSLPLITPSSASATVLEPAQSVSATRSPAALEGLVTDASGLPISGAVVVLRNVSTGLQRSERTDTRGRFEFRGVNDGGYEVVATISGFAP